jgi:uncharacterized membrane protein YdjX (TVP38/TMEM64 family)
VAVILLTLGIVLNRSRMDDLGALGYAGAFLAMLLSNATLVLPAPGLVIVFALGSTLNPILVGLCAGLGATLGEITGYVAGYGGLGILVETPTAVRLNGWMERNGTLTVFALSLIPNPFFDLAGMLAGAGRMSLLRFLAIAFVGKSLQSIGIALAGALSLGWVEDLLAR